MPNLRGMGSHGKVGENSKIIFRYMEPMTEKPSADGPPPTIMIHPGHKESTDEETTNSKKVDHDIPPPVKAFNPETPPMHPRNRKLEALTKTGMLAVILSPFVFLFLDFVPQSERDGVALFAAALFFLGLGCIVLAASKGERRKSLPRTIIIPNQPAEDEVASPYTADLEVQSDNPWIDGGDEAHSFWASMVEDHQVIPSAISSTPIRKEIPVSYSKKYGWEEFILWNIVLSPLYVVILIFAGTGGCIALLSCQCMFLPEVIYLLAVGDTRHKARNLTTEPREGSSAIWVVVLIAIAALMTIAFW